MTFFIIHLFLIYFMMCETIYVSRAFFCYIELHYDFFDFLVGFSFFVHMTHINGNMSD